MVTYMISQPRLRTGKLINDIDKSQSVLKLPDDSVDEKSKKESI